VGAATTNLREVTVSFGKVAPDAQQVRFNFNGQSWQAPVAFGSSMTVTLPNWVGTNYVNAEIIYAGGQKRTAWDAINYAVPTVAIDGGAALTHSRDVTLSFGAVAENATSVEFGFNGGSFGGMVSFQPILGVRLPNWDGINYVNAKIHYADGRERVIYDSIDLSPAVIVQASADSVAFRLHVKDAPSEGFRDPVLGDDRVAAFAHAMGIWSELLVSRYEGETVVVEAKMDTLDPFVLGEAGANDFSWLGNSVYGDALANHRLGYDVHPATAEVTATFSSAYDWYLGVDDNPGLIRDLVSSVIDEIGHGLNFFDGILDVGSCIL
jgi:hypothetical protein